MCKVSDKLRLCSCSTDINSLKHYWILYRVAKGKNIRVIGDLLLPYSISPESDQFNRRLLLKLLNEENAFDAGISPIQNDRLEISFTVGSGPFNRVSYGFAFRSNQWKAAYVDPFGWEETHDIEKTGKVRNALVRLKAKKQI